MFYLSAPPTTSFVIFPSSRPKFDPRTPALPQPQPPTTQPPPFEAHDRQAHNRQDQEDRGDPQRDPDRAEEKMEGDRASEYDEVRAD
ncbi:hypothetical protein GQ43DRAFT_439151 [Delitschia confertaspora ATCC 74209]|uniref:Uncharacterized protein n=1 Tax=Delitschia confertaspora ATCC 74209 TaxID=1513339 RepID=A0A9P4JP27_9PLEO|nr:hypothetical protein GQ43DRAFT_439151 [Delitschia confertaspora ATCC 74209]